MTETDSSNTNAEERSYKVTASSPGVSRDDKALLKFGEEQFIGSIDNIKNFSQTMITLESGLFAVYFALLQFLGIEDIAKVGIKIATYYVALPPVLIILSLIAFVFAILPLLTRLALSIPEDISIAREKVLKIKFTSTLVGVAFLVTAMAITIDVCLKLLRL